MNTTSIRLLLELLLQLVTLLLQQQKSEKSK